MLKLMGFHVVMCVANRIELGTEESLARLGRTIIKFSGCSDVALARSTALTRYMAFTEDKECDGALLVDADMVFSLETVDGLVELAKRTRRAVSADYVKQDGTSVAERLPTYVQDGETRRPLFTCGLGLMFIPRSLLQELRAASRTVEGIGGPATEYTKSFAGETSWMGEDRYLCHRLGGVLLHGRAGHIKLTALWPKVETP